MSWFSPAYLLVPARAGLPTAARRGASQAGFTVLEAGVAGAVLTVVLVSLFVLNSDLMHLLRAASETANASQDLQQRVEAVRLANWNQVTNSAWVQSSLFNTKTDASVNLPGLTETVTVAAYTSPSSAAPTTAPPSPFTVTRNPDGSVVGSAPAAAGANSLGQQEMVRIDLSVQWPSLARNRTRSLTTLVSRWGISK